jgi:exodeoxyribonuclease-5
MHPRDFYYLILEKFPFEPTKDQIMFFQEFVKFLYLKEASDILMLKGYAGTGKTTAISTLTAIINKTGYKYQLWAPTGRAAKVMSVYAQKEASTIHRKIYFVNRIGSEVKFVIKENKFKNTLFFVDEVSMISEGNERLFDNNSLLKDLINYVYEGKNCKLILIGDTAQLPPVKQLQSPALDVNHIQAAYQKTVMQISLTQVMRQEKDSGILSNATRLRDLISKPTFSKFKFQTQFADVVRLTDGYEIQDALAESYQNYSPEDTVVLVWSNKRANLYNNQIRQHLLGLDSELSAGDFLMVVRNNYYWMDETSQVGFIANGDMAEVLSVRRRVALYGFQFAEVTFRLVDYPDQESIDAIVLLDTLQLDGPSLSYNDLKKLYDEIALDYLDEIKNKAELHQKIKENPYYNALQVKFSYAITCHKAQGGQWKNVFIEKPYLPEGENVEYLRWLYTAITRAQEKVYLIGYKDDDFEI